MVRRTVASSSFSMTWPRHGPKDARSAAFIEAGECRQRCEWNMSQPTSGDGLFW